MKQVISLKIGIIINLKHPPKEYIQLLVVLLRENARKNSPFSDSILNHLRMGKKKSFLENVFRGKARQLNHHILPLLKDKTYDAAATHVGINDLFSNVKSTNDICENIIDIGLRCRNKNIGMIFISSIAYSSKVNSASVQLFNGLLFDECRRTGFKLVDNGEVSDNDLWTDDKQMIQNGKRIIANDLINSLSV